MKKLFTSPFKNNSNNYLIKKNNKEKKINDTESSGSYLLETNHPLTSTRQLNIDYSLFENHTFFHSAVVKINEIFEKINNTYPFDGTKKEIDGFNETLNGFEKYVIDLYPKNNGYLIFSGTQKGESQTLGTYISVKDNSGIEYPTLSTKPKNYGKKVLDSLKSSFTIQFFVDLPRQQNDNQIIFQKRNSLANHTTVYLSSSSDVNKCNIGLSITSGTFNLNVTSSINKGTFNHISAIYDRVAGESKLILFNTGSLIPKIVSSSNRVEFDNLFYQNENLNLGYGENFRISDNSTFSPQQSFSGSLDELRYFHKEKTLEEIKKEKDKTIYSTESLKLYYKFNEPYGDYEGNNIVLDSSGNNLTSEIKNFNYLINRSTGSFIPLEAENKNECLVFFPDFSPVETLYDSLIVTGTLYDKFNPNIITKLIPPHYIDVGNVYENFDDSLTKVNKTFDNLKKIQQRRNKSNLSVQNILKFLFTWAKHFDELKIFVDNFSLLNNILYEEKNTVPDIFLQKAAQKLGVKLPYLFEGANLNQFLEGFDVNSSLEKSVKSLNEIQNSIWRRVLSDVPFYKKTKGTLDSVKSVFRNAGIEPDNIFDIREYGGAKEKSLEGSVAIRKDVLRLLNFSGSIDNKNNTTNAQGRGDSAPYLVSKYLSSSRIEIGSPHPRGTMVQKESYSPHGISNNSSDGLLTSGSFTYQANYLFKNDFKHNMSLARIHTTGSSASSNSESCIVNFHTVPDDNHLILSINDSPTDNRTSNLILTGINLNDNDIWSLSFGRECSELKGGDLTGSIFIRAAKYSAGEEIENYYTSSLFPEKSDSVLQNISSQYNASGSFIVIGSQSFLDTSNFLNSSTQKQTYFSQKISNINFWSYALNENEFKSFAKNPNAVGTKNPIKNYNFNTINTGSFERLRIQTFHKQNTTSSNAAGDIKIFDFTKNNLSFSGKAFEPLKNLFHPEYYLYQELSPNFDLNTAKSKIRIRSLQNASLLKNHEHAQISPVYEVNPAEEIFDDTRFSIDMSVNKGLNQNILSIFSDFTSFDDALGKPNLVFADRYPDLITLRKIYFENVISSLDLNRYREIFKWVDSTFSEIVYGMLPRSTNFLGINLVYDSHVLERNKISYMYDEIYLKSLPRDAARGNLFLSQFVGKIKKS